MEGLSTDNTEEQGSSPSLMVKLMRGKTAAESCSRGCGEKADRFPVEAIHGRRAHTRLYLYASLGSVWWHTLARKPVLRKQGPDGAWGPQPASLLGSSPGTTLSPTPTYTCAAALAYMNACVHEHAHKHKGVQKTAF